MKLNPLSKLLKNFLFFLSFSFFLIHSSKANLQCNEIYDRYWRGNQIPFNKNNEFLPECAPEVLYSWQEEAFVDRFFKRLHQNNQFPIQYLYAFRSPIGTFAYGNESIRIKLKKETSFILLKKNEYRNCDSLTSKHGKQSIFVRLLNSSNASEYLVCSLEPIESISSGWSENLNEIEKEFKYIQNHKNEDFPLWDSFTKTSNGKPKIPWKEESIDEGSYGNNGWSLEQLQLRIDFLKNKSTHHFYSTNSSEEELNLKNHFQFEKNPYFLE